MYLHIRRIARTLQEGSRGVTLVELIVTLAIFGAVTALLLVSFITLFSTRDQIDVAHRINDNVRNTLDGIEREIQTGNSIEVLDDGSGIRFTVSSRDDQLPYQVEYRLKGTTIEKGVQKPSASAEDPCKTLVGGALQDACFLPLTDQKISVNTLHFTVISAEESQGQTSPLVTLGLEGSVEDSTGKVLHLSYSTSITPRNRITTGDGVGNTPPNGGGGGNSNRYCTWTNAYGTTRWLVGTSQSVGGISGINCSKRFCCEGEPSNISVCNDPGYADEECP